MVGIGASGTHHGQFGNSGATEPGGFQLGVGGFLANQTGDGGALVRIARHGCSIARLDLRNGVRFGQTREVPVFRHQPSVLTGLAHRIGKSARGDIIGDGPPLAFPVGNADVGNGVFVVNILVDAVVGETGESLF